MNYATFSMAEQMHTSVRQLLTGEQGALTAMETYLWMRYRLASARLQQQRGRK